MTNVKEPNGFGKDYYEKTYGGSTGEYEKRATPNKWRSMSDFVARFAPNPAVALDCGCAEGIFLEHARARFPRTNWRGADVSEYAIERAKVRNPGIDIRRADLDKLPYEDDSFDLITCFDVLEHVESLSDGCDALARVLRPGGLLFVSVPVYDGPLGWVVQALDKDPTHIHKVARSSWLSGPLSARFELIAWEGLWRYYFGRYWHFRSRALREASPAILMAWRRKGGASA